MAGMGWGGGGGRAAKHCRGVTEHWRTLLYIIYAHNLFSAAACFAEAKLFLVAIMGPLVFASYHLLSVEGAGCLCGSLRGRKRMCKVSIAAHERKWHG